MCFTCVNFKSLQLRYQLVLEVKTLGHRELNNVPKVTQLGSCEPESELGKAASKAQS